MKNSISLSYSEVEQPMPLTPYQLAGKLLTEMLAENPPQVAFCIYCPGISKEEDEYHNIFMCKQYETIRDLENMVGERFCCLLRSALKDYIFPSQRVIVIADSVRQSFGVSIVNLEYNGDDGFSFDCDYFSSTFHQNNRNPIGEYRTC